jgi:hypothetical protein
LYLQTAVALFGTDDISDTAINKTRRKSLNACSTDPIDDIDIQRMAKESLDVLDDRYPYL